MKRSDQTARVLRVLSALKSKGQKVTQRELSSLLQLAQPSLSQILSGKRDFPQNKIPEFCRLFSVNPSYIYSGELPMFGEAKSKGRDIDSLYAMLIDLSGEVENLKFQVKEIKKSLPK